MSWVALVEKFINLFFNNFETLMLVQETSKNDNYDVHNGIGGF